MVDMRSAIERMPASFKLRQLLGSVAVTGEVLLNVYN